MLSNGCSSVYYNSVHKRWNPHWMSMPRANDMCGTLFWKRQIHQLPKIWAPVWHVHCVLAFVFGRCENNRFSFFFFGFALKPFPFGILRRKSPQISHSKLLFLRNKCGCHQMLCLLGSEIHTAIPERNLSASRRKQPGHLNKLRLITKQTRAKKLKRWQMPEQTANAVKVTNRWEIFVMPGQTSWFVCVHMSSSLASLHVWLPNRFKFPAIEQRAVATSRSGGVDRTQINYVATGQRRERRKKIMAIQKWSRMWRRWRWWS